MRLTSKWTDNSEDAFGDKGAKGDKGESVLVKQLKESGIPVEHFPKDQAKQIAGIDMYMDGEPVDNKNNLWERGPILVDKKKIHTSEARFWTHTRIERGILVEVLAYAVSDMLGYIERNKLKAVITKGGLVYEVPRDAPFITRLI